MPKLDKCPVCQTRLPAGALVCPDCKEDLAPLIYLRSQSAIEYNRALALVQADDLERATLAARQAVELEPSNAAALLLLAKILARRDRRSEAKQTLARVLELVPGHAGAQAALSHLEEEERQQAEELGRQKQAEAEALRAKQAKETELAAQQAALAARQAAAARRSLVLRSASLVAAGIILVFLLQAAGLFRYPAPTPEPMRVSIIITATPAPATPVNPTSTPSTVPVSTSVPTKNPTLTPSSTLAPSSVRLPSPTPTALPDLRGAVSNALTTDPRTKEYAIQVEQNGLIVQLSGEVPDAETVVLVTGIAQGVTGVQAVNAREILVRRYSYTGQLQAPQEQLTEELPSIAGWVVDAKGQVKPDVKVVLDNCNGLAVRSTTSGANGWFMIDRVTWKDNIRWCIQTNKPIPSNPLYLNLQPYRQFTVKFSPAP